MINKTRSYMKQNLWGDDHPEKLKQRRGNTLDTRQQLKSFVSPDAWMNQLFGQKGKVEKAPFISRPERKRTYRETLVFSYATRKEEGLKKETEVILQKLKEQITILEKSGKNLAKEVSKVKLEKKPKKSTLYFVRFLEWLLIEVRKLRIKAEEGRAWLATFNRRKKKKLGYWKMYKKYGTTFGLSHERVLATQTG